MSNTQELLDRAYIAGVLHGDGYCTALYIGLRVKDEEFAEAFRAALSRLLNKNVVARLLDFWVVRLSNKSGKFNTFKSFIPSTNTEKAMWLRGMFDSEGNAQLCEVKGKRSYLHRRVSMYSTSMSTLKLCQEYLTDFGINVRIRATKNSVGHLGTLVVYELALRGRNDFQAFSKLVGSSIQRKQDVLDRIAASYVVMGQKAKDRWKTLSPSRQDTIMRITLPAVLRSMQAMIAGGIEPSRRNFVTRVPKFGSVSNLFSLQKLVEMAEQLSL